MSGQPGPSSASRTRLHVPNLPHTEPTKAYDWCAYTAKVRKFKPMMERLGYEVIIYNPFTEDERRNYLAEFDDKIIPFEKDLPIWVEHNRRCAEEIRANANNLDFLCIIGGGSQRAIADACPELYCVEFGVGYSGVFANCCVYESYAWMHAVYGMRFTAHGADGRNFDAVIPNYFEVEDFPMGDGSGDYLFYIGRLIPRKGVQIVGEIQERTGLPLIVAGEGDTGLLPKNCEYVGLVDAKARAELMGNARCVLVPTIYLEPFGGVNVEAQLCGTPVITSDWGGFVETVEEGKTGFRCRMLRDFCAATEKVKGLDRGYIRDRAIATYSTDVIGPQYDAYFKQVQTLTGDGWYSL